MSLLDKYEEYFEYVSTKLRANMSGLMERFITIHPEYASQIEVLVSQGHNFLLCSTPRSLYYGKQYP